MAANQDKTNQKTPTVSQQDSDKRTYSVEEIASILQISRTKAYDFCKDSDFKVLRIGRLVRISKNSFDEWLDRNL